VFIDLYTTLHTPWRDIDIFESLSAVVCLCGEISHPSISLNNECVLCVALLGTFSPLRKNVPSGVWNKVATIQQDGHLRTFHAASCRQRTKEESDQTRTHGGVHLYSRDKQVQFSSRWDKKHCLGSIALAI
jgi:hypothetical protein